MRMWTELKPLVRAQILVISRASPGDFQRGAAHEVADGARAGW